MPGVGFRRQVRAGAERSVALSANTLGQDIARHRKTPKALSPDWALPDQVSQMLRHEVPVWLYLVLIAIVCLGVYLTLDWLLGKDVAALAEQISQLFNA